MEDISSQFLCKTNLKELLSVKNFRELLAMEDSSNHQAITVPNLPKNKKRLKRNREKSYKLTGSEGHVRARIRALKSGCCGGTSLELNGCFRIIHGG
jgi:hypothetical protein